MDQNEEGSESLESVSSLRQAIRAMWADIMGIKAERVSIHENFFTMGGGSLQIVRLMDRVNSYFFCDAPAKHLPISDFFDNASVDRLAKYLRSRSVESKATEPIG